MRKSNEHALSDSIKHRDPNDLKPPVRQITKPSAGKIAKFAKKIDRLGLHTPILIDKEGIVVTGWARVLAARKLGLKTIPTLCHENLSPEHLRAIRVSDNFGNGDSAVEWETLAQELAELSALGFDSYDMGFDTAELDRLEAMVTAPLEEEDAAPDTPPSVPTTRPDDLWMLGDHRIICADCRNSTAIDRLMMGRVAAACVTDGPYNVPIQGHVSGLGKNRHEEFAMAVGELSDAEFEVFNAAYLGEAKRVVKPGGYIYAFMDWRGAHIVTSAALSLQLLHANTCCWVKSNAGMGSLYRSQHELALVFRNGRGKAVNNVQLGRFGRSRSNVWNYAGANSFGRTRDEDLAAHPTVKPVGLIEDIIKDCTHRGDVVIDLFGGSGTTMLAAERCKRAAMLCEIDPGYVDVTIERFAKVFEIEAVHEATGLTYSEIKAQRSQATA